MALLWVLASSGFVIFDDTPTLNNSTDCNFAKKITAYRRTKLSDSHLLTIEVVSLAER